VAKVGNVAYELNLPSGSQIHPVFHVSQLKKRIGPVCTVQSKLPIMGPEGKLKVEPVLLLDRRIVKKRNQVVAEVLVQWANMAEEEATWENYEELIKQFPNNCLEDKTKFKGKAMSGTEGLVTVIRNIESVNTEEDRRLGRVKEIEELGRKMKQEEQAQGIAELMIGMEEGSPQLMEA